VAGFSNIYTDCLVIFISWFLRHIGTREEDLPDLTAPVFDLLPEAISVEEGDTAKFMVKISGNPRPRLTWWVNGTIVVNVSKLTYSILT